MVKPKKKRPSTGAGPKDPTESSQLSPAKRRWFRVIALLVVPFAALALLEGGLRLAGYGFPTSFFLEKQIDGRSVLVENDRFGWRFFPRQAARSPSPTLLAKEKAPGTFRIFLFGESAALGDPRPAYGIGRYLEVLLSERFPSNRFEVVCVAMTAINSHAILPIARECARYDGDLWIVYMGNNEMEGPFGANPIFGFGPHSLRLIRASLAIQRTRIGQLFQELGRRLLPGNRSPATWEGMKMFVNQTLPPEDPRKEAVYRNFERNLRDILRAGLDAGARPILCTVASNLKDCGPFASLRNPDLSKSDQAVWDALFAQARQYESTGEFQEALRLLDEAARIDDDSAELYFRSGWCSWWMTNYAEAKTFFTRARDRDALPFRTDTRLNEIIRNLASQFASSGVRFVDTEAALAEQSPGGNLGHDLFYDHVHFNFDGNYFLARRLAEEAASALELSRAEASGSDWASAELCAARLGLTDWNRKTAYEGMLQRLQEAPFTNQSNHAARNRELAERIIEIRKRIRPESIPAATALYEEAIKADPDDFRLHENFAEFLEAIGNLDRATAEWRTIIGLLPHHQAGYFHLGRLLSRQQKAEEAERFLVQALSIRPDLVEARLELGKLLVARGRPEEAMKQYATAREHRPEDSRILVQMADALAAQDKRAEAEASLREAIRLRPSDWEARYLLGVELALSNRFPEALAQFQEVIRLRPDHSLAHFNLGVALAKSGRLREAAAAFEESLRLNPNHAPSRQYLEALQKLESESRRPSREPMLP